MNLVGHGIDIVDVPRVRVLMAQYDEDFVHGWFTSIEQAIAGDRQDRAVFYAGRMAAKEAIVKALGTGFAAGIVQLDIEVGAEDSGAPVVNLFGAAHALARELGINRWSLSISNTEQHAVASAIALQDNT
jgi:holo-[acyl-carrier protein] synthase